MKKILIGIGESKFAEHATEYGFELAHKLQAEVGLIHVIEPAVGVPMGPVDSTMGMSYDNTMDIVTPELMNIEQEVSKKVLQKFADKYGDDFKVTRFTEYGDTADAILECSKQFGADMIVLGTHSRTGIDRFIMGSVAEHVVRHSDVPVLVVPTKEG
ncbi:universal stress protein [Mucilaginibacter myungsuensis]|uniref:Universal stress protein n=1 Tax=Mucilaginibacter myungsuensis TaxID=649104 RepID=A0A929KXH9_9SPHI|nr:universal stress protein [Mucilaginibacter myungsuensis]MBE9663461.1 universal stress protein [Mucilaginibacter myungsuensis]MDN3600199.1 universal stress protein [Mucilaginibacter myungsuensis]